MRDKTIGCICDNDDAIECLRGRDKAFDDDYYEGEACSCTCHDYMQDEEEAMKEDEIFIPILHGLR